MLAAGRRRFQTHLRFGRVVLVPISEMEFVFGPDKSSLRPTRQMNNAHNCCQLFVLFEMGNGKRKGQSTA